MKVTAFLLSMCFFITASATNYYFSASSGNDSYSSAQAQDQSTPWRSIDKLNAVMSSLNPGDIVYFKRGDVFYGSIYVTKSGVGGAPITFTSYGSGANPVISGYTVPSGWTSVGGGIWETTVPEATSRMSTLLLNNTFRPMGRFPNIDAPKKGHLFYERYSGNTSITDNELVSSPNWTGAEVVIRKNRSVLDRNTVTNHSGNTISYTSESHYGGHSNHGYFFQNHPQTLDQQGEWYFNLSTKKLGIYLSSNPGSSVKASTINNLVTIKGLSNLVFDGLSFEGANNHAFDILSLQNVRIVNCSINYSGVNAIHGAGNTTAFTVENCIIDNTNNIAVMINNGNGVSIKNNKITNTGTNPGMGKGDMGSYNGIMMGGVNNTIEGNSIENIGFNGITFGGNNLLIKNNFINNFLLVKGDGGAIYTWGGNLTTAPVSRKIIGNIITNGDGAAAGTDQADQFVHGIFLDDNVSVVEITGNTIAKLPMGGIFVHNAFDNIIKDNTFFDNWSALIMSKDAISHAPVANNTVTGNIFLGMRDDWPVVRYESQLDDLHLFGTFNYNYYARPTNQTEIIRTVRRKADGTWIFPYLTVPGWHSLVGQDANSKPSPKTFSKYSNFRDSIQFFYNNTAASKTIALNGNYIDVKSNQYNGSITLAPYASAVLLINSATTSKTNQTISFDALPNKTFGDPAFPVTATASSGLPVSFRIASGPATVSGNTVTLTGEGTVSIEAFQAGNTSYNAATPVSQSFTVISSTPSLCAGTGSIIREQWNNVLGNTLTGITQQQAPHSTSTLTIFEANTDIAENFESRIRGYVCPPQTGNYTFWIAGDDATELWLSTGDNPANKVKIAYNLTYTAPRQWNTFPTQKSAQIYLIAGQKYYIEALHKEGIYGDHLAVSWQLPNGITEAPIPGNRLAPFEASTTPTLQNQTITFAALSNKTYGDPAFTVNATASSGLPVSFRVVSGSATISGNTVTLTGAGTVTIEASQAGNTSYNAATPVSQSFSVTQATTASSSCSGLGSISREQWNNVLGNNITGIAQQQAPHSTSTLTMFEANTDIAENFESRIRGYICPPQTGNYTFWIAGDDATELWLSTDGNPANKVKIAYNLTYTAPRQWNTFPTQKSVQIYLTAGQKYYIEALHKEGIYGDHLAVSWQLPNGVTEAPIPGNRLAPFEASTTTTLQNQTITFEALSNKTYGDPAFTVNATASSGLPVSFRVVSGSATISGNTVTITGAGTVITIEASQAGNTSYNAATPVNRSFLVTEATAVTTSSSCSATGSILREQWNNIKGINISSIPVNEVPSSTSTLTLFEAKTNIANNYGARVRGYICPPVSGNYTFWIAGDDATELWLSTDANPANKVRIAYNLTHTGIREWNRFSTQKSVEIYLAAGQKYYIEALQKEDNHGDHLSVSWKLPNGLTEAPIPGNRLSPFNESITSTSSIQHIAPREITLSEPQSNTQISSGVNVLKIYPNPVKTTAAIRIQASESGQSSLKIYDLNMRLLYTIFQGALEQNVSRNITFNVNSLASGVYIIALQTKSKLISEKIVVAK